MQGPLLALANVSYVSANAGDVAAVAVVVVAATTAAVVGICAGALVGVWGLPLWFWGHG